MSINIDRLAKFQKALGERKRTPTETIGLVLKILDFKETEIRLYDILLKKEMIMDEIVQTLDTSERSARSHIKTLYEKGFVKKRAVIGDRLKYAYSSVSPEIAWRILKNDINRTLNQVNKVLKNVHTFL